MIEAAEVQDVIGRWWWSYDEGEFEALSALLTEDAHFTCRTDSGPPPTRSSFDRTIQAATR